MGFTVLTSFVFLIFVFLSIWIGEAFDINKDLVFRLYTREEPVMYYALHAERGPKLNETTFNHNRPTRVFVHGFRTKEKVIKRYAEAYLNIGDYNFIAVDWIEGASTINYFTAKGRVRPIAEKLAGLLDYLHDNGMRFQELTIVGHSLGAHIAGRACKLKKSPEKVAVIIGLDPASVAYDFFETEKRLADTDAEYVQIIHTDSDKFGFATPLGHADMYPNGGKQQPGCPLRNRLTNLIEKCSHVRSHHLFLESLMVEFPSIQCVSFEEINRGQCTFQNVVANMGGDIAASSPKPFGIFYLETKLSPPYVIPDYRAFNNIQFV